MGMGQNPFFLSLCSLCLLFCFGCVPSSSFIVEEIKLWLILWSLLVYTHFRNDSTGTGLNVLCSSVDRNKPESLLPFRPFYDTKTQNRVRQCDERDTRLQVCLCLSVYFIDRLKVLLWSLRNNENKTTVVADFIARVSLLFRSHSKHDDIKLGLYYARSPMMDMLRQGRRDQVPPWPPTSTTRHGQIASNRWEKNRNCPFE